MELVSVVMSVYNEEYEYIKASIDSILNQTYTNIELIIVCDNSNLEDTIERLAQSDARIKTIVHKESIGLAKAMNEAIHMADGEYIARMDADDISLSERIDKEYDYLSTHTAIDLVCTGFRYIDDEGNNIDKKRIYPRNDDRLMRSLSVGSIIAHPTVMFRKELFNRVGGYNNYLAAQDYDLWLRMRDEGARFHYIREELLLYRKRKSSVTEEKALIQSLSAHYIKEMHKKHIGYIEKEYLDYISTSLDNKALVRRFELFLNVKELNSVTDYLMLLLLAFVDVVIRDKLIKNLYFYLLA